MPIVYILQVMASIPLPKVLQMKKENELETLIRHQVSEKTITMEIRCVYSKCNASLIEFAGVYTRFSGILKTLKIV